MSVIQGNITALITPSNSNGVDLNGLRENIDYQLHCGVDGLLILGTTGESPTMTRKERTEVIKTTVRAAKGKALIMVGTGTNCTKTTFERTEEAQILGADCALIVTPYYNCPSQEGIYRHVQAIHANVELPICLYNHPKRTGTPMETSTIKRLAALPRVIAIKDATGDTRQMHEINDNLSVIAGDDTLALEMIENGADGVISVVSNLIPKSITELINAAREGRSDAAREIYQRINPLLDALTLETNPIPIKTAMTAWDLAAGPCRLPLWEMEADLKERLLKVLAEYEDLKPTALV